MAHLARSRAPRNWPIKRKETKWITRPNPGAHPIDKSISVNLLLKRILNCADTTREIRYIINNRSVLVDKVPVKDHKTAIGFMDIIDIPEKKETYRLIVNLEGELELITMKKELDNLKPTKIIGKTMIKGKKVQLNLIDSRNIIVDKDSYNVGDTVVMDLSKKSIVQHLKLEKGAEIFLMGGKHKGAVGKITDIIKEKNTKPDRILMKTQEEEFETLKEYAFVIDKKFLEK